MKEFIFEDKTENLMDLIGFPRTKECFVVINAELNTVYPKNKKDPLSSYPNLSPPSNPRVVRENALKEAFLKGVKRIL